MVNRLGWTAALMLLVLTGGLLAGTTGKIKGTITNQDSKAPVPGASVKVVGTTMGASTDQDGAFFINAVPPGVYALLVEPYGYVAKRAEGIRVTVDQTAVVNLQVKQSEVDLGLVQIVEAPRDLVRAQEVHQTFEVDGDQFTTLPLVSVEDAVVTVPGIVQRGNDVHVRGGRDEEVAVIVDGVDTRDPSGGYDAAPQSMNVSGSAIQDVQVIKGGYTAADDGGVSGIFRISTLSGTTDLRGHLEYFTDDFGSEALNRNSFNWDRLQFRLSGPEPLFCSQLLPKLGIDCFDSRLTYALSGSFDRGDDYASFRDYFTAGARRDYRSHNVLGLFDFTERSYNEYEARLKLTWQASAGVKITFNHQRSWDRYTPLQWNFIYTPATASRISEESSLSSLKLTHQLDPATFYEVIVSRWSRDYLDTPSDPAAADGRAYPDDFLFYDEREQFADYNGDGVYTAPEPFVNVNGDTSWYWGGPFYTVGDAWLFNSVTTNDGRTLLDLWPTLELEYGSFAWRERGIRYGSWRGADMLVEGAGNSSTYVDTLLTDWNGNGVIDFYESEPFVDVDGDGFWDANDYFDTRHDSNNNDRYDAARAGAIGIDRPEPYLDGDRVLGEPFTDVNFNGHYDEGLDLWHPSNIRELNQDLNTNSQYDGPDAAWSPGMPYEDRNGNDLYDPPNGKYDYGEPFLDLNHNGKWDPQDGFLDRGYDQWAHYHNRSVRVWTADLRITKQMSQEHELSSGFTIKRDDVSYADLQYPYRRYDGPADGGPWSDRGAFRDFYHRRPVRGSCFVQDRMEYGAMVASLGLRYDFFIQATDPDSEADEAATDTKSIDGSKNKISPRIGFSYPISDRAKVFFNYGHYYQLPELSYMYQRATQSTDAAGIIGNENLDYMKTIQYECGCTYRLSDVYVLNASGFYKDEFGKVNSVSRSEGPIRRSEYANVDYGRTRGLEAQLEKKYGDFVSGYVNYTYMFAYGKSSSERSNYFDDFYGRAIPITEYPLDWDERHQIAVDLDFHVAADKHPQLFGLRLPDNWGFNVLWQFGSGFPYTPAKDYPGIKLAAGEVPQKNSLRMPAHANTSIRAWKRLPFLGAEIVIDLWINNLFDNREVLRVYESTGRHDTDTKSVGADYVLQGDDLARNPLNLGAGRNIRLGLGIDFGG